MSLGALVRADNKLGIGKVVGISDKAARVLYFESVARQFEQEIPVEQLIPARLARQTRCYVQTREEGWKAGRISKRIGSEYEVDFPGAQSRYLPERVIFVRCSRPVEDPTEILIAKAHETAFFHRFRAPFMRSLIAQRAATRGMSGLVSARIELMAHQVEVVRRVLEDPIQRYLLADEVGLGKTIEAGAILRQFLLDEPMGRALVLTPPYLVGQWRRELDDKFVIGDFDDRVEIRGTDELSTLADEDYRFVIADEAHHIAHTAASSTGVGASIFDTFRRIAHRAERVLLLSATPALHNEVAFLAMLHLIDPANYSLEDLQSFRARLQQRQAIGHFLFGFKEGLPEFPLAASLEDLREWFPEDRRLRKLTDEMQRMLDAGEIVAEARDRLIRQIRIHLTETYRLHQRFLRNRRSAVDPSLTIGRAGPGGRGPTEEYDLSNSTARVHEALEDWREAAYAGSQREGEKDQSSALAAVFRVLVEAAGTWQGVLPAVVRVRLAQADPQSLHRDLSPTDLRLLSETPLFAGEDTLLGALLEVAEAIDESEDRVDLLVQCLGRGVSQPLTPKTVVFTSHHRAAGEIHSRLITRWGSKAIALCRCDMLAESVDQEIRRFEQDPTCNVLVCDRTGEEGQNLQFADALIHFDLPISASRIEQRIGRLDRIGRLRPLQSKVLLGPDLEHSLFAAWFEMLDEGLGVFRESVSGLQFFLDARTPTWVAALFRNGAAGLREAREAIGDEIRDELLRVNEQQALDSIEANSEDAQAYLEALEALDASHAQIRRDTEGWLIEALHMGEYRDIERSDVVRYKAQASTLIPQDYLLARLGPHVDRFGTYRRTTASLNPGVVLYRLGEVFTDAIADYIRWDDRGQAFAIWRQQQGWPAAPGLEWLGFRLDYVITADSTAALEILRTHHGPKADAHALQRLADLLLPPIAQTIFIGVDGEVVQDTKLLKILERRFQGVKDAGRDQNLTKEYLPLLNELVPSSAWPSLCQQIRETSEIKLLAQAQLQEALEAAHTSGSRRLERRLDRLRARAEEGGGGARELVFEAELGAALLEGVHRPEIRADAIGFIVVSGRSPIE